jgi:hypothetical protein
MTTLYPFTCPFSRKVASNNACKNNNYPLNMSSIVKSPLFFGVHISEFMLVKQSSCYNALKILAGVVFTLYLRTGFLLIKDSYSTSNNAIIPLLIASILLVLVISYIGCSIVNTPFTLTAKVKLILAVKALLLLGIVILTIFDITHTILDIVAECGVFIGGYCVGSYTLSCTMNNAGGSTGGNYSSSRGASGSSPGGNTGGGVPGSISAVPAGDMTEQQARNYQTLMGRHSNGENLPRLDYDNLFTSLYRMKAQAYRGLNDENTPLLRRIELRGAIMEFDKVQSSLLISVLEIYPDYRLP